MLLTAQLSNIAYQIFRLLFCFSDVQLPYPHLLYRAIPLVTVCDRDDRFLISIFSFLIIEPLYISWPITTQGLHFPASFASSCGHVAKVGPTEFELK